MRLSSRRCCFGTPNAPREIHSRVICDRKAKKKAAQSCFPSVVRGTGFEPVTPAV